MDQGVISARQFMIMVGFFTIGSAFLLIPYYLVAGAKQDAWITSLIGMGAGIVFVLIYSMLDRLFPDKTFVQYSQIILGNWLGKAVSLLYIVNIITYSAFVLFDMGDFLDTYMITETPVEYILIIFMLLVIAGIRYGIGTLGLTVEIFFPLFIVIFILLIVCVSPELKLTNVQPILENGMKPVIKSAISHIGFPYLQISTFLMIMSSVREKEKVRGGFLLGVLFGGSVLTLLTTVCIFVLGVHSAMNQVYPGYVLAQSINIGDFFTRVEVIIAFLWFITIFYQLCISFYAIAMGLAQVVGLHDYRTISLPLGLILIILSMIFVPTTNVLFNYGREIWWVQILISGLIVPLVLLATTAIRKRLGNM